MPSPFICRQCIARLTQSRFKPLTSKRFQLHTQAVSTSVLQPAWGFPGEQRRGTSVEHEASSDLDPQEPLSHSLPVSQNLQDGPVVEQEPRWNGRLKKFTPRRRADVAVVARESKVTGFEELKEKILQCLGDYQIVHKDLMNMYGLSREEARHAVNQLERLLWGRHSRVEAAERLGLFHIWKRNFSELLQISKSLYLPTEPDVVSTETVDEAHPTKQDLATVKDVWHRLSQERRAALWPRIIITAFRSNPGTLLGLIEATFEASWCPSYAVEDTVYLLFRALDNVQDSASKRQQLTELIFFLLENCPPRYLVLEQMTIHKAISSLSTSRVAQLYEALTRVEAPLSPNTLLQFASRFARESKFKVHAAEVIHSVSSMPGFDINSPPAASVCTTLLMLKEEDGLPSDYAAPDELFKMLLDAGFRPNLLNLTALMRNFCIRRRVEIAWSIFNILIERGNEPDSYVFSTLLNGSKLSLDVESLRRSVDMIEARVAWSPRLINDLLDFIYQGNESQAQGRRRQRKRQSAKAWRMMVRVYAKFFDLAPLQKLTLFPLENLLAPGSNNLAPAHLKEVDQIIAALPPRPDLLLMQPDSVTLVLMLRAHFRSIDSPHRLWAYYRHFGKLLKTGDPTVTKLVKDKGTSIYGIFLRDFMQYRETFKSGIRIVQNMQDKVNREKKKLGKDIFYPPPSVCTYTILMDGLGKRRHTRGVITALNMMIKEGIKPNIVTWNTVIKALLRDNYLEEAVRVMRYLEHIGLESNDRTVREVTNMNKYRRKGVAYLMKKLRKKAVDFGDERSFANSLLDIWEKKERDEQLVQRISMRSIRRILKKDPDIKKSSTPSANGAEDGIDDGYIEHP
ncbi:hypothetical protein F5Y05DRAFT_371733 [Hypoxylon sp. FL0543]|nr:hypothetical protein F5Y05DRAFT_371733 [Hypoxylon sp. FL0543]